MKNAMEEAGLGPSTNGTSNQSNQSQEQTEETPVEKADRLIEELQEITEVKGDASPDEVSERASRETELYAELLEVLRHLSKVIRKLKYEGQ
ncbi:MAG: hypothetical protein ABEJ72_07680, partial [Candidatus Aenigmatarchaeota archaeon]